MIFANGSDFPFPLDLTKINPFIWDRNSDFSETNYTRNRLDIYRQGTLSERWSFIPYMPVEITPGAWVNIQPEVIAYNQSVATTPPTLPPSRHDGKSDLEVLGSLADTVITEGLKGTGKALNIVTLGAIPEDILVGTYQAAKDWVADSVVIPAWGFYAGVRDSVISFENLILPKIEATLNFIHETWQRHGELITGAIAWLAALPFFILSVAILYKFTKWSESLSLGMIEGFKPHTMKFWQYLRLSSKMARGLNL